MTSSAKLSRRSFATGAAGGLFCLAIGVGPSRSQDIVKYGGNALAHGLRDDPTIFLELSPDGTVTFTCHRAEMGQGIRTSLAMVVADELEATWSRIRVVQAPADEARFGNQDTDGSRSMRHHFLSMRRVGAGMRQMLEMAAASHWDVPISEVAALGHQIRHSKSDRRLDFGYLAEAASVLPVPPVSTLKLKVPSQFRYIGRDNVPIVDGRDIVAGRAQYGSDIVLEGMAFAVIARPPVYGGKVKAFDATNALRVPGVFKVLEVPPVRLPSEFQPLGGIAVVASNTWAAISGREKLKIEWEDGPNASYDSDVFRQELEEAAAKPGIPVRRKGDVDAAMSRAAKRYSATYYIPHQPHLCMEPPVAVAFCSSSRYEIWAPVQTPEAARLRVAQRLRLPLENITLHQTLLGGGFGRKSQPDFVVEAAILASMLPERPIKVQWTREDDLQHDYFGTVGVQALEAGLDASGRVMAWRHRSFAPTITSLFGTDSKHEAPFELGQGFIDAPFDVPNMSLESGKAAAHTRIGWFRSVSNLPHAFAVQSFVAELAWVVEVDPKEFLLNLIGPPRAIPPSDISSEWWDYSDDPKLYPIDTGRLRRVIELVTRQADWEQRRPKGRGLGLAAHRSFGSYVASVVEVEIDGKNVLRIPQVNTVIDCGAVINPDRIRAQLEGAVVQGIGIALNGGLSFKSGRPLQFNFNDCDLPRMGTAACNILIDFVDDPTFTTPLGGVGEPGLPPIPPAFANALFAASGRRLRSLPIAPQFRQPTSNTARQDSGR